MWQFEAYSMIALHVFLAILPDLGSKKIFVLFFRWSHVWCYIWITVNSWYCPYFSQDLKYQPYFMFVISNTRSTILFPLSKWLSNVSNGKMNPTVSFDKGAILLSTGLCALLPGAWVKTNTVSRLWSLEFCVHTTRDCWFLRALLSPPFTETNTRFWLVGPLLMHLIWILLRKKVFQSLQHEKQKQILLSLPLLIDIFVGPLYPNSSPFIQHTAYTKGTSLCLSPIAKSKSSNKTFYSFIQTALKWQFISLKLENYEDHLLYYLGIEKTRFDKQINMQVLL